jgi:homoserine kinase
MNSENYTIDTAADAFNTSTRNIRSLIQRVIIPRTIEIEGQKARQLLPEAVEYLEAHKITSEARAKRQA